MIYTRHTYTICKYYYNVVLLIFFVSLQNIKRVYAWLLLSTETMRWYSQRLNKQSCGRYSNMVQTTVHHLWQDAKLLPYLLPPFGADALFSGDNFITFDNSFFHFNGNCNSYLLAADLYHNTFSLFANYDRQVLKQNNELLCLNL